MQISESELEDYLIEEWDSLELIEDEKLKLIARQVPLWEHGPRVDILAKRPNGNVLVIELKAHRINSDALEQVLYYKQILSMVYAGIDPKDNQRTVDCMLIGGGISGVRIGCAMAAAGIFFVNYCDTIGILALGQDKMVYDSVIYGVSQTVEKIKNERKARAS